MSSHECTERPACGLRQQQKRRLAHVELAQARQAAERLPKGRLLGGAACAQQVAAEQECLQPRRVAQVLEPARARLQGTAPTIVNQPYAVPPVT